MEERIHSALNHLGQLNGKPFELQSVAKWLYDYDDLYKEIKQFSENICDNCQEWLRQDLPLNCLSRPDYCTRKYNYFTDFYESVEKAVKYNEFESLCKDAIEENNNCKSVEDYKNWLKNYDDLANKKLAMFLYNHFDFDEFDGGPKHPHFANSPNENYGVSVNRKYYVNTITFIELYHKLNGSDQYLPKT